MAIYPNSEIINISCDLVDVSLGLGHVNLMSAGDIGEEVAQDSRYGVRRRPDLVGYCFFNLTHLY
jgi:hypothetical protein